MFEGMDDVKQTIGPDQLKNLTFKDIFRGQNKFGNSLKRSINYSNYSKMGYDMITKKE